MRPRTAQKRTSGDTSALSSKRRGTAAGSRGRKSAHAARQRTSASAAMVHRRIGAMSSRVVNRPIARSASPTTGAAAAVSEAVARYFASAARAGAVRILPRACAASRATAAGVVRAISSSESHDTASGSFSCPVANATVARISTSSSLRADTRSARPPGLTIRPTANTARRRTSGWVDFSNRVSAASSNCRVSSRVTNSVMASTSSAVNGRRERRLRNRSSARSQHEGETHGDSPQVKHRVESYAPTDD